jgi:hypothetical protein
MYFFWSGFKSHQQSIQLVIWQLSRFIGGGRPQVPFYALFQTQTGTRVEPSTFCKLAHLKEVPVMIETQSGEGQVV